MKKMIIILAVLVVVYFLFIHKYSYGRYCGALPAVIVPGGFKFTGIQIINDKLNCKKTETSSPYFMSAGKCYKVHPSFQDGGPKSALTESPVNIEVDICNCNQTC